MRTLSVVGLVLLAIVLYGAGIEPRFLLDDSAHEAELPGLPAGWDGKTLAVVGDFQIGMWLGNTGMVEKAVATAIADSVAAFLIAGDFLYRPDSAGVREAVRVVQPLIDAGVPTVAVLGNHDYSLMKKSSEIETRFAEYLTSELRALGVTVLENDATPLVAGGDTLWVAGVGPHWADRVDVEAAQAAMPEGAPRVWLMHNAEAFRDIPAGQAPLALAAHTHGGQIRVLPGEHTSWLDIVQPGEVVADGWAADTIGAPGNRAYINRGIGFSTVPIRINCRPELTLMTLRAPDGPALTAGAAEGADR